ncbi:MAG: LamG-like jellyroll fold domain-containing protein [Cytophagales bacterium]
MLRRLLFFIFVFFYSFGSFAQSFELSASQALNSSKDSLLISVFVRSTTVPQELGSSSIAISTDSSILDITSIALDSINTNFNSAPSYNPMEVGVGSDSTFIVLSVRPDLFPPTAPGNNVLTTPTFVARIRLLIKDKCVNSDIGWNGFPAGSVVGTYGGAFDTDPDTIALFSQAFLLRDSIGGTVAITALSDTLCQGTDVDIAFLLNGEVPLNVRFRNGTDSYLTGGLGLSDPAALYTPTITGEAIYTIDSIQDVNGCWESNSGNFTDDTAFIDTTVPLADAGNNDSVCVQPKTYTLNGNDPTVAFNGMWTANSSGAVFIDDTQFNTDVTVDTGGYYYFTWTISSLIDGATGACPSEEDSVQIRFFRRPDIALAGGPNYDTCTASFPADLQLFANQPDTGTGVWTIIGAQGGSSPSFDDNSLFNAMFNTDIEGVYDLSWTISNGNCTSEADTITIRFDQEPSNPIISTAPFSQCEDTATLSANTLALGTGLWTNNGGAIIATANNPTTAITLPYTNIDSTIEFYWNSTSTFTVCPQKRDTLLVTRFAQPDNDEIINPPGGGINCGDVGANFFLTNTLAGSTYSWTFPGGFTITAINNIVDTSDIDVDIADPAFSGDIVVEETTINGCRDFVDTLSVVPAGCTFTANFNILPNDTVCVGEQFTLISVTAGSIPGSTQYQWDTLETGGFTSLLPLTTDADTVLATINDNGTYQIRLTASEPTIPPNPAVDDTTINVVVLSPPDATFVLNSAGSVCIGDSIEFQVNITGGAPPYTLEIDTGGGLPITITNYTSGDPIYIVPTQGTSYSLSTVSDNFTCSGGTILGGVIPITVNPLPTANLSLLSGPTSCTTDSAQFQIDFTAGTGPFKIDVFRNALPDTIINGITGPSFQFYRPTDNTGALNYFVDTLTDNNGCISTPGTGSVLVNTFPGITNVLVSGGDSICLGESDTISFTVTGGTPNFNYVYETITTNTSSSTLNVIYSPLADSTVTLDTVYDSNGCAYVSGDSTTTTVNPLPTATISGQAWICEGDATPLTFSGTLASDTIYYSANGIAQGTQIGPGLVPVSPTVTTNYTIDSIIDANACQVVAPDANIIGNPVQVFVNPAITSAIISGGDIICEGDTDTLFVNIVGGTGDFDLTLDTTGAWLINNYISGDPILFTPFNTGINTTTLLNVVDDSTCSYAISTNTTTTVNSLATATINVVAGGDTICSDGSSLANIEITLSGTGGPYDVTISDGTTDTTFNGLLDGTDTLQLSPSSGSAFDSVEYVIVNVLDNNSNCPVDSSSANISGSAKFYLIQPYVGTITPSRTTNDLCFGESVTLSASNTAGYANLQWLYGGNPIAGETASSITVDYTGVFTLEAGISACVATSDTIAVLVAPPIDSVLSILNGDSSFCENDSLLISVPSVRGNALGTRTSTAFVQTTFDGVAGNAPRTLEAWILTDTAGGIMGYGNDADGEAFVVRLNENGVQGNFGALKVQVKNGYITGTTDLTDSVPHHIAVVFNGDSVNDIRLYVDGVLDAPTSGMNEIVSTNIAAGTAIDFRIGTPNLGPFIGLAQFGGRVDEVRFWDVALDQVCINNNKDIPLFGSEPGLVGLWNFEDTTGGDVKDLAGSNPGTLQPGAIILTERGFYNPTVSYEWFEASGPTSVKGPGPDFFLWVTSGGDYYVDIDLNGNCVKSSDTLSLREVIQNPSIAAGGPTNICFGDNVLLTATGQTALEDSTIWHYASNPIAGATGNTFTADASGAYSMVFFDDGCADTSNVIIVDVAAEIDTSLSITGDTVLCDGDTTILSVPLNGGNNLNGFAKPDVIRNVANPADVSFIQQTGKFTLQYWQKLTNPNQNNKINAALGNAFNGDPGFFAGYQKGSVGGLNVGAAPQIKMHLDPDGLNDFVYYTTEPGGIISNSDTNWHQLTLVVDSNNFTFYIDGTEITNTAVFNPITYAGALIAPNELTIGDASSYSGGFGDLTNRGGVDEVRIWNIPLDSATIANNWNRPLNGNEPGLVALFDLDEDTSLNAGDNVNDLSVNAYTGTMNGGAIISNSTNSMPSDSLVYQWFRDGIPIAGATSNQLIVDTTGDYHVEISTADLLCTESSRTVDIDLFSVDPQVNVLTTNPACFGDTVQLQAVNNTGAIDSVRWYYGKNTAFLLDSINNPYGATLTGNYTVEIFNNVCSDTSSVAVDIAKAIDTSLYVYGDSVLCEDEALILVAPKYGSNSLQIGSNGNRVINIGNTNDFRFIHEGEEFSFEAWIKGLNTTGIQAIAGNANASAEAGFNFVLSNGAIRLRLFNTSGQSNYLSPSAVITGANTNSWNHIAVSYKNDTAQFYLNGVFVGQDVTPYTPFSVAASNSLAIGGIPTIVNFSGNLDELRIWKTALSQQQISQNFQRPLNYHPDIVTVFGFDADTSLGNGDNLSDNAGTLTGTISGTDIGLSDDIPAYLPSNELTYQWYQGVIPVGNGDTLIITTANFIDSADYYVEINNTLNCGPIASRTIRVKENLISDTLFASPTEFCFGTDSARVWVQLDLYDSVEIYNLQSLTPLAALTSTTDTFYASNTDTVYGVVYNSIDGKLCTKNTDTIIITAFENPTLVLRDTIIICYDSGTVLFDTLLGDSITNGSGIVNTYAWSPNYNLSDSSVLNAVYSANPDTVLPFILTITDDNGCFDRDTVVAETNPQIVVTLQADTTICFDTQLDLGNGNLIIGGKAPGTFAYLWDNDTLFLNLADTSNLNAVINGDSAGVNTYALLVTDVQTGCIGLDTIIVTVNDSIDFTALNLIDTICFNTPSIVIGGAPTAQGGSGVISSYAWTPSTNLDDSTLANPTFINPSVAGTYSYTVIATDSINCARTSNPVTVEVAPEIIVDAGSDTVACFGDSTITIGASPTASGGFGAFTYEWTTIGGIPAASTYLDDINLPNPTIQYGALLPDTLFLLVTVSDSSSTGPSKTLCNNSDTIRIIFNPEIVADPGNSDFTCFGIDTLLNGSATGGTNTGYTFQWIGDIAKVNDPTNPNSNFTGDASGLYNLNLIAFDNTYPQCSDTSGLLILEVNDTININAGNDTILCFQQSTELGGLILPSGDTTGSGGSGTGFSYLWTGLGGTSTFFLSNTSIKNPIFNQGASLDTLFSYQVLITDNTHLTCFEQDTINITVNQQIIVDPNVNDSLCIGDTLVLGGSPVANQGFGGFTYLWSSNLGNTIQNVTDENPLFISTVHGIDSVKVIVTDARTCRDSASITVEVDSLPNISFIPSMGFDICRGEDTTLIALSSTGNQPGDPLTFTWNNGDVGTTTVVQPNADTTYEVTVVNVINGCTNSDTINIVVNPLPYNEIREGVTILGDTLRTCSTPNILALQIINDSSTNATSFWSLLDPPGPTTIPATSTPSISIFKNQLQPTGNTIANITTDTEGCVNYDTLFITTNNLPNASFLVSDSILCFGDSITLQVTGVPNPPAPAFTFVRNTPTAGSIYSGTDSTVSFVIGSNTPVIPSLNSSVTFEFEVLINTGCQISLLRNVLVNPNPDLELVASDSLCNGADALLSINNLNPLPQAPLDSFIWNITVLDTSQVLLTSTIDTIINVVAYDTNGCVGSVQDTIFTKALPDVSLNTAGPLQFCDGDTAHIFAPNNPNYIYEWKDIAVPPAVILPTTINLLVADTTGQYFVTVTTDGLACTDSSLIVSVLENPLPVITLDTFPISSEFCFGDSVMLRETNSYPTTFYTWTEALLGTVATGTNLIYVSDSGQFKVIVTDNNGCIDSSAVQEFFELPLSTDSILGDDTVCALSTTTYTSNTGNNGTWILNQSFGTIQGATLVGLNYILNNANSATIDWATANNAQLFYTPDGTLVDCPTEDTFDVVIVANPVASLVGPNSGCVGDNLSFSPLNAGDTYSWTIATSFGNITNLVDSIILALDTQVPLGQGQDTASLQMIQTAATGCMDTTTLLITKYDTVNADFIAPGQDTGVCQFDIDTFTVQNIKPGVNYTFNITSGAGFLNNITNGQISIAWNFVGSATVRCIAVNGDCSDTVFHSFSIQATPVDSFDYYIDNVLQTSQITNVCESTDSVTYRLRTPNFTNDFTWTLLSPGGAATALGALDTTFLSVAINAAGSYILTMVEETGNGCSITLQETVTINAIPTYTPQVFDTVICETAGQQIYSYITTLDSTGESSIGWSFSDTDIIINNDPQNDQVLVDWGGPGIDKWIVPFFSSGDCAVDGDTIFMDVEALPMPFITPDSSQTGGDTIFCQNLRTFFFANPSDTAATYQWFRDGTALANSDTSRIRITESGTYNFSIITSGGGCFDSTDVGITATVLPIPEAEITGDTLWCGAGRPIDLSSVNTATAYQWFEDTDLNLIFDSIPNSNVRDITVNSFGNYLVVLTNAGGNNCTDTSDVFIISPLAPAVSLFQFDSISSFCNNEIVPLNGNNAGRLLDFEWITNGQGQIVDPFTDTTTYIPSDLDSGAISFEFIVTNFCNEDISIDTADLRVSPDASYTPSSLVVELNETVIFNIDNEDATLYSWVFQPGATGSGPTGLHTYTQAGDFLSFLIAVNEFNCEDSFAVPIHVTRNQLIYVPNVFSPNATNPDNQVMRVYGTNISATSFEITIFNRWGIKVFESTDLTEMKINGWNGSQSGSGPELPSGVYTYYIKGQFFNGEAFQQVGTVNLIK